MSLTCEKNNYTSMKMKFRRENKNFLCTSNLYNIKAGILRLKKSVPLSQPICIELERDINRIEGVAVLLTQ